MITIKNVIFTHYASVNMLKFFLNFWFLSLWWYEMAENC